MISQRARLFAIPSAAALLFKQRFRSGRAAAAGPATPAPWAGWPEGFTFARVASSAPMDLSQASRLAMFRLTYQPGAAWTFAFPYPILVSVESGSLHLNLDRDRIEVGRPVTVSGQSGETSHGIGFAPATSPTTLTAGESFSSQSGNVGATRNDGDAPVVLLVAGAIVQPPLTEETTSSTSDSTPTP